MTSTHLSDLDIGFKTLWTAPNSEREPTLDIIAIHGIGAHPDKTWGTGNPTINWLVHEEMLPSVAQDARIMRYGYMSQWFGDDRIKATLVRVANMFLVDLKRERENCQDRPMVFIAHCFGGLVLAQALIDARNHRDLWPGIHDSTTGIAFFGTPFRGAEGMTPAQLLEMARREYTTDKIDIAVLEVLDPDAQLTQKILDDFSVIRQPEQKMRVACFYETKPTNVGLVVGNKEVEKPYAVSERSGCLDTSDAATRKFGLQRNHFQITKYAAPGERDFKTVLDAMKWMISDTPALMQQRQEYNDAIYTNASTLDRRSQIQRYKALLDDGARYLEQGRHPEAERVLKQAISGFKRLEVKDRSAFLAYYNLGTLYWALGNCVEAEENMTIALAAIRAVAPKERYLPDVIHNMGLILVDQGKLAQAEQLLLEAGREYRRILSPDHRSTLRADQNLSQLQQKLHTLAPWSGDLMELDE